MLMNDPSRAAMNVSFFLLILTLFALAYLTKWNAHVLMLMGVSTLLWGAMMWYVPYLGDRHSWLYMKDGRADLRLLIPKKVCHRNHESADEK